MEQSKLVEQMLKEKGDVNNSIDLDAYARGLIDMHEKLVKNNIVLADVSGDCLHPYNAVRRDKITELCRCSICEKEWY